MNAFNSVTNVIFDILLGWFGSASAYIDIIFWSLLGGVVALMVYKLVSNQKGIERTKNDIKVHLLEIRLFQDDIGGVVGNTGKILVKNVLYIGHNIVPMLVMIIPMMAIIVQLVSNYAYDPLPVGERVIVSASLDREHTDMRTTQVGLALPDGVRLVNRVRAKDDIGWEVELLEQGDHELQIQLGDETVTKTLAVGGEPRKVPVMRTKSLEGFLFPTEGGLDADSALYDVRVKYPTRPLAWLPDGEAGILMLVFALSLGVGFALKGVFGVTL